MQLCKCLNCFFKTHNKQLNQYCLNFIFLFFTKKKKSFKKLFGFGSGRRLGWIDPQKTQVGLRVNLFLLRVKKIGFGSVIFRVGSKNSYPFCHVQNQCILQYLQHYSFLQNYSFLYACNTSCAEGMVYFEIFVRNILQPKYNTYCKL